MGKLTIRPYMHGDRFRLAVRPEQDQTITPLELANTYQGAHTFSVDGVPVLIGGIKEIWAGRAVAWALVGEDIPAFAWRGIFKFARRHLHEASKTTKRIEAYALWSWHEAVDSLDILGFEQESVMANFTQEGDYMMGVYCPNHSNRKGMK